MYICISYSLNGFTAFYRFQQRNVNTNVSTVYAVCETSDYCDLISPITNTQLPIEKTKTMMPLDAESHCRVDIVEIIHDCLPRSVDVKLRFESKNESDCVYLQVKNLIAYKCNLYIAIGLSCDRTSCMENQI